MSKRNYNLPEVHTKQGKIVSVDYEHDLADVEIDGVVYPNVKIHYHCDETEQDKGGSSAFSKDDYVLVLLNKEDYPLEIFGFVGDRKPCEHDILVILPKEDALGYTPVGCYEQVSAGGIYTASIWNLKKDKLVCEGTTAIDKIINNADTYYENTEEKISFTGLPIDSLAYDDYTTFLVVDTSIGIIKDVSYDIEVPFVYCGHYAPEQAGATVADFWYYMKGLTAPTFYPDLSKPSVFHSVNAVIVPYYNRDGTNSVLNDLDSLWSGNDTGQLHQLIIRSFEYKKGKIYLKRIRVLNVFRPYDKPFFNLKFNSYNLTIEDLGTNFTTKVYEQQYIADCYGSNSDGAEATYKANAFKEIYTDNDFTFFVDNISQTGFVNTCTVSPGKNDDWSYIRQFPYFTDVDITTTYYSLFKQNCTLFPSANIQDIQFKQFYDNDFYFEHPIQQNTSDTYESLYSSFTYQYTATIDFYEKFYTNAVIVTAYNISTTFDGERFFIYKWFSPLGKKNTVDDSSYLQDTFVRGFYLKNNFVSSGELLENNKTILNIFIIKIYNYVFLWHHIAKDYSRIHFEEDNVIATDLFMYYDDSRYLDVNKYVNFDNWKNTGGTIPYNTNYIDKTSCSFGSLFYPFIKYKQLTNYTSFQPLADNPFGENNLLTIIDLQPTPAKEFYDRIIQRGDR